MDITTLNGRNLCRATKAAQVEPVFITDGGHPTHVLLTVEAYRQLAQPRRNIADALAIQHAEDVDFEPPRLSFEVRPADLT